MKLDDLVRELYAADDARRAVTHVRPCGEHDLFSYRDCADCRAEGNANELKLFAERRVSFAVGAILAHIRAQRPKS